MHTYFTRCSGHTGWSLILSRRTPSHKNPTIKRSLKTWNKNLCRNPILKKKKVCWRKYGILWFQEKQKRKSLRYVMTLVVVQSLSSNTEKRNPRHHGKLCKTRRGIAHILRQNILCLTRRGTAPIPPRLRHPTSLLFDLRLLLRYNRDEMT